jgi:hypothetical protein
LMRLRKTDVDSLFTITKPYFVNFFFNPGKNQ